MEARVSLYNGKMPHMADQLIVCDVTMRDGEQAPFVMFSLEEKKGLARKLDQMGIQQIQLAMAGTSEQFIEEAKELCALGLHAKTELMTRGFHVDWRKDIDSAIYCGSDIIHSFLPASRYVRGIHAGMSDDEIKKRSTEIIEYIRKKSDQEINISLMDATRTEETFLLELVHVIAKSGAHRIRLADSVGVATPEAFYELVSKVREAAPNIILGVHCHNDFGLAFANVLAAIKAGATLIDVSVNGLGERCGNAALSEVVVGLSALYGFDTGIDLSLMKELSEYVEKISGVYIPENKPLVGKFAFSDTLDLHIVAQQNDDFALQGIFPEDIGNKREIVLGKYTGPAAVVAKAKNLGIHIDEKYHGVIASQLRKIATQDKQRRIGDEDFLNVVHSCVSA